MQELEPRAGEELERLIERYARVRLDPKPSQARRARAAVMEERLAPPAGARPRGRRRRRRDAAMRPRRRGPFAAGAVDASAPRCAAAVLAGLLVGSTAFAASRAGGPLYEPRLSLEALTLPSDPTQRLDAELARAQTRIAEIAEAASRGDDGAMDAAVRGLRADARRPRRVDRRIRRPGTRRRDRSTRRSCATSSCACRCQAQSGIERALAQQHGHDRRPRQGVGEAAPRRPSDRPTATRNAGGGEPERGWPAAPNAGAGGPDAGGGDRNGGGGTGGGNPNGGGGNGGGGNGGGNPNGWRRRTAAATARRRQRRRGARRPSPSADQAERHGQGPAPSD